MPCLSELELLRDLTVSQNARVADLEKQIEVAYAGLGAVARALAQVRDGVALHLSGILPIASVSIIMQAHDVVLNVIAREQRQIALAMFGGVPAPLIGAEALATVHPRLRLVHQGGRETVFNLAEPRDPLSDVTKEN